MNDVQADCTGVEKDYQVGELRVWRGWRIDSLGRLTAITKPDVWRPTGIHARCMRDVGPYTFSFDLGAILGASRLGHHQSLKPSAPEPSKEHVVPDPFCTCGVYCYYDPSEPIGRYGISAETPSVVFGIAEVWGRVLVGEKGLRAEHARPVALVKPHGWRWTRLGPRAKNLVSQERWSRALRNYPDVQVYRSARKALSAMPLWTPTFDTSDPLFWERPAS